MEHKDISLNVTWILHVLSIISSVNASGLTLDHQSPVAGHAESSLGPDDAAVAARVSFGGVDDVEGGGVASGVHRFGVLHRSIASSDALRIRHHHNIYKYSSRHNQRLL